MTEARIDLQLLPGYAMYGDERIVLTPGERELLLALALHRRGICADRLAEVLWPHATEAVAKNRLYVALHRIRRRLGEDLLLAHAHCYRLDDARTDVDLWALAERWDAPDQHACDELAERLENAMNAALLYEIPEWLAPTYRRLEEFRQSVVTALAERALCNGEIERSMHLARRALAFDECDERAWAILIRSRLIAHDRLGALREYRTYSRAVMRELQAAPAYELAHLFGESLASPTLINP
ncbi:MAG: AfsR/SARP family transcriptional regulator [Candidatus Baltobacteraceae bacterium]